MSEPRVWNKRDPNVPKDAVYVGRPSKWGNPFIVGHFIGPSRSPMTRTDVIERYYWRLINTGLAKEARRELYGKDLVCWCAPLPCHADVLLKIANAEEATP